MSKVIHDYIKSMNKNQDKFSLVLKELSQLTDACYSNMVHCFYDNKTMTYNQSDIKEILEKVIMRAEKLDNLIRDIQDDTRVIFRDLYTWNEYLSEGTNK